MFFTALLTFSPNLIFCCKAHHWEEQLAPPWALLPSPQVCLRSPHILLQLARFGVDEIIPLSGGCQFSRLSYPVDPPTSLLWTREALELPLGMENPDLVGRSDSRACSFSRREYVCKSICVRTPTCQASQFPIQFVNGMGVGLLGMWEHIWTVTAEWNCGLTGPFGMTSWRQ